MGTEGAIENNQGWRGQSGRTGATEMLRRLRAEEIFSEVKNRQFLKCEELGLRRC